MGVTFTFDAVASSTVTGLIVRDVQRPIVGTRRDTFVEIPGRAGSYLFTDKPGDRELYLACAIAAGTSSALRTSMGQLATLVERAGACNLILSDQSDRYWLGRFTEMSTPRETVGVAEFDLTFRCQPYAFSTSTSSQALGPTTTEPYTTTFSVTTDADTPFQLDVTPSGGTLPGCTVTVNGDALTYASSVADGQVLAINTNTYVVTNNAAVSMSPVSGTFGRLVNGTNSITFDRTSGATSVSLAFTWRRRYL